MMGKQWYSVHHVRSSFMDLLLTFQKSTWTVRSHGIAIVVKAVTLTIKLDYNNIVL